MKKKILIISFLLLLISPIKLRAKDTPSSLTWHFNLSPLFYAASNKKQDKWVVEFLGPFFTFYHSKKQSGWLFKPLFSWKHTTKEKRFYYLYPLGKWQEEDSESSWYFVPFFKGNTQPEQSGEQYSRFYWPIFWGRNKKGEFFWGVFPLYGTIYNRYGMNKIKFILWPLYTRSEWGKNYRLTMPWPFFSIIRGPDEHGIKIWPLYEHIISPGRWEKRFVLWPFYLEKRDLKNPKSYQWMFLPFYAKQVEGNFTSQSFLWPFFRIAHNPDDNLTEVEAPWPFIRYSKDNSSLNVQLWPLIGFEKTPNISSYYFIWSCFSHDKQKLNDGSILSSWRLLFFSKLETETNKKDRVIYKKVRIWPLFNYKRVNQNYWFAFPELNPFDIPGIDLMYGSIFHILEIKRTPESGYTKFLWGLYRHYWNRTTDYKAISFLYSSERSGNIKKWCILGGLFGRITKGRQKNFIIFFKPTSWWGKLFHRKNKKDLDLKLNHKKMSCNLAIK